MLLSALATTSLRVGQSACGSSSAAMRSSSLSGGREAGVTPHGHADPAGPQMGPKAWPPTIPRSGPTRPGAGRRRSRPPQFRGAAAPAGGSWRSRRGARRPRPIPPASRQCRRRRRLCAGHDAEVAEDVDDHHAGKDDYGQSGDEAGRRQLRGAHSVRLDQRGGTVAAGGNEALGLAHQRVVELVEGQVGGVDDADGGGDGQVGVGVGDVRRRQVAGQHEPEQRQPTAAHPA